MAADPHNVVRLILPRPVPGRPGEEYHHAAESLGQWQDEHILVHRPRARAVRVRAVRSGDERPGWVQRGLIGAIRLVPPEAGIVLPHEDVAPGPVAGRLALMEATQANLEPIFLLYDGHATAEGPITSTTPCDGAAGATARIIAEIAAVQRIVAAPPLISTCTSDGLRHQLWAITDPAELAAIAADLGPRQALIADGHHRYAAYLQLQARRRLRRRRARAVGLRARAAGRLGQLPASDRGDPPGHPRAGRAARGQARRDRRSRCGRCRAGRRTCRPR